MLMPKVPYPDMTTIELAAEQRQYPFNSLDYNTIRAEIDRRVALAQIDAANAQRRSAWLQFWAMVAMFLTVVATFAAPYIGYLLSR